MKAGKKKCKTPEAQYLRFARAVLAKLAAMEGRGEIPQYIQRGVQFQEEEGYYTELYEKRFFYGHALKPSQNTWIDEMEETKQCVKTLTAAGVLEPVTLRDSHGNPLPALTFEQTLPSLAGRIVGALLHALKEYGTHRLTDRQVLRAYRRSKDLWRATGFCHQVTIPLTNFSMEQKSAKLREDLKIDWFPPIEKSVLFKGCLPWGIEMSGLAGCHFRLSGQYRRARGEPARGTHVTEAAERAISALRLFKAGRVGALEEFHTQRPRDPSFGPMRGPLLLYKVPEALGPTAEKYVLTRAEVRPLRKLHAGMEKLAQQNRLGEIDIALRWFNLSYTRVNGEDRIIDFAVCLESCLLRGTR